MKKLFTIFVLFLISVPAFAVPGYKEAMKANGYTFVMTADGEKMIDPDGSYSVKNDKGSFYYDKDGNLITEHTGIIDYNEAEIYIPSKENKKIISRIGNRKVEYNLDGTIRSIGDEYVYYK